MGERTGIAWTERTWNPWMGCTKVSAGCDHCYMFREQTRYGHDPEVVRRSKTTFDAPLHWQKGAGSGLVFTCSWSDWFHKDADPWRDEAWEIIRRTPHLTYQILTKRPGRIARHLPAGGVPLNVWLGVSVENQREAHRLGVLCEIPAPVRFVSAEPLLGPLSLDGYLDRLHWVIAGGESGTDCRPMELDWARSLRDECASWGVPFFLKQLGGPRNPRAHDKAILDGRTHTDSPHISASSDGRTEEK